MTLKIQDQMTATVHLNQDAADGLTRFLRSQIKSPQTINELLNRALSTLPESPIGPAIAELHKSAAPTLRSLKRRFLAGVILTRLEWTFLLECMERAADHAGDFAVTPSAAPSLAEIGSSLCRLRIDRRSFNRSDCTHPDHFYVPHALQAHLTGHELAHYVQNVLQVLRNDLTDVDTVGIHRVLADHFSLIYHAAIRYVFLEGGHPVDYCPVPGFERSHGNDINIHFRRLINADIELVVNHSSHSRSIRAYGIQEAEHLIAAIKTVNSGPLIYEAPTFLLKRVFHPPLPPTYVFESPFLHVRFRENDFKEMANTLIKFLLDPEIGAALTAAKAVFGAL
jgi:hypothetical protein